MASCIKCGKSEPAMRVVCGDCIDCIKDLAMVGRCGQCRYILCYDHKAGGHMCGTAEGLGLDVDPNTDYCSRFKTDKEGLKDD